MHNLESKISTIKTQLEDLIVRYKFLKDENELLIKQLAQMQEVKKQQVKALETTEMKYKQLKLAKTIEGSNEDRIETKKD